MEIHHKNGSSCNKKKPTNEWTNKHKLTHKTNHRHTFTQMHINSWWLACDELLSLFHINTQREWLSSPNKTLSHVSFANRPPRESILFSVGSLFFFLFFLFVLFGPSQQNTVIHWMCPRTWKVINKRNTLWMCIVSHRSFYRCRKRCNNIFIWWHINKMHRTYNSAPASAKHTANETMFICFFFALFLSNASFFRVFRGLCTRFVAF